METPGFLKHIIGSKKDKPENSVEKVEVDFGEKQREALKILVGQYKKLRKQIEEIKEKDIDKALELADEVEKVVDKMEAIKKGQMLIDDIEKIIGAKKEFKGKGTVSEISGMSPEGEEISFELKEQAEYWNKFYVRNGVDWVDPIPEEIKVTEKQAKEMMRLITEFGFNKMLIVPNNLVGQPEVEKYEELDEKTKKMVTKKRLKKPAEHYEKLHELMSAGYNETLQNDDYVKDGGFGGSQDSRTGFRIILTKEVQNLEDDVLFKSTKGKSVDDLEAEGGIFQKNKVQGLTEAEYLILQRDYQENNKGKHLDEKGWTWLPGSRRRVFGRVPYAYWSPAHDQLSFCSYYPVIRYDGLGCRLAGNFEL